MNLLDDIARCNGVFLLGKLEGCCKDCARRMTPPVDASLCANMPPPLTVAIFGECEDRIGVDE